MAEVTLRRFELSDVDAVMAWASDPQVAAFCRWEPYDSREPLLAFLRDVVLPHPWYRAVCLAGDEIRRPVGAVYLAPTAEPCRGELGYLLARAHWGKGVATAAVRRALRAVFAEVGGLARVEALVDVDNPASQRVAEKAGLRREGVLSVGILGWWWAVAARIMRSPKIHLGSQVWCVEMVWDFSTTLPI